jgi:hypothetical protein
MMVPKMGIQRGWQNTELSLKMLGYKGVGILQGSRC